MQVTPDLRNSDSWVEVVDGRLPTVKRLGNFGPAHLVNKPHLSYAAFSATGAATNSLLASCLADHDGSIHGLDMLLSRQLNVLDVCVEE
jgi:hypothetical protein